MENLYWPQDYGSLINHSQSEVELHPWLPPADEAADYGCYHPAAFAPTFDAAAEEGRAASASRSHSEAEKRRRDRINAQLATLRKLIPKSEKMDKAALLGHVVEHVKEQRQRAKEMSKNSTIPTEIDEVMIDQLNAEESNYMDERSNSSSSSSVYVKASICCDDRPELFAELKSALEGMGATIVEADITSLGGRMKANFILRGDPNNYCCTALKMALTRLVIASGSSAYSARSKRQRFFYPTWR